MKFRRWFEHFWKRIWYRRILKRGYYFTRSDIAIQPSTEPIYFEMLEREK